MSAAIFYAPDGYTVSGPKLMGRQAAGVSFLRAMALHQPERRYFGYALNAAHAQEMQAGLRRHRPDAEVMWLPLEQHRRLAEAGTLYVPGPGLAEFAYRRLADGGRTYSLCGVTHTTASHSAHDAILDLAVAPLHSWDALICTSRSVRDTVRTLLEQKIEYLRWRLGAARFELPQLPLIPLGVHGDEFARQPGAREAARRDLGISDTDIVLLFVGRLSFHAKAHPLPMYRAAEDAAARTGRRLHLIQCGWFANDFIERSYKDAAQMLAPSVNCLFRDGRDPAGRAACFAAADIFVSLSDNVQETFGLAPLEAMAAGLPLVVSDWDGYRDTVADGVEGFRVPTLMPPAPLGQDLAARHDLGLDTYDMYCGHTSQLVAVDTGACTRALVTLIADPSLRQRMGEVGRRKVETELDWRHVMGRYQALWAELAERRRADPGVAPQPAPRTNPRRPDPFLAFASYPTTLLSDHHRVALVPGVGLDQLRARRSLAMVEFARYIVPAEAALEALFSRLSAGPLRVADILAEVPGEQRFGLSRGLVWLAKLDLLQITPPGT